MPIFRKVRWLKYSLCKSGRFRAPLGALSGPGPPNPDVDRFHIKVTPMEDQWSTPKTSEFHRFYWHLCLRWNPSPQEVLILAYTCDKNAAWGHSNAKMNFTKSLKFLRFWWHVCLKWNPSLQEVLILADTCDKTAARVHSFVIGRWTRTPERISWNQKSG